LREFAAEIADFADTAALIACCDLVISIDTSVAHLAGAMGKPVWVLLPYVPDWRWLLDRQYSPWYPTARLFRQRRFGDWPGVIRALHEELLRSFDEGHWPPEAAAPAQATLTERTPAKPEETDLAWLLDQAIALHQKGALNEAERLY